MPRRLSEYRLFFTEFRRNFHSTGAILSSGQRLAAALARYVDGDDRPRRILEVGPGTGAVTSRIVAAMKADDHFDLVELNESFVRRLRHRFETEPDFLAVADRTRLLHCAVEELSAEVSYNLIISGLPLNNFSVRQVELILSVFARLLAPGGILSFFQYMAIRRVRSIFSRRAERERLRGIGRALGEILEPNEIRREWIWPNVPPAWVHHVRFD